MPFCHWSILAVLLYTIQILAANIIVSENSDFTVGPTAIGTTKKYVTSKVSETVLFNCSVDTNITWKYRNSNSSQFKLISSSQIFRVRNLSLTDEGMYVCYSNGELVAEYHLTVLETPYFLKKRPSPKLLVEQTGNTAKLKCRAGGYPKPNITWYKDGKIPKTFSGNYVQQHWSLILGDLAIFDKGNYTCIVCNEAGCINFTYILEIIDLSQFYIKDGFPKNITALVNSSVQFECPQKFADLDAFITWSFAKLSLKSTLCVDHFIFTDVLIFKENANIIEPDILEIRNVTYEDEGWYACGLTNGNGYFTAYAYLDVVNPLPGNTTLDTLPDNFAYNNQHCTLKCTDQ